jgi:phosphoribosyl-ATP pyrophosphohydrolase
MTADEPDDTDRERSENDPETTGSDPETTGSDPARSARDARSPGEVAVDGDVTADGGERTESIDDVLAELFAVVEDRKETLPEDSYTASLFTHEKGENAVLEKLGEETTELVLAAKDDDDAEIAHESADIVYHILVLLAMNDLDLDDLERELAARR